MLREGTPGNETTMFRVRSADLTINRMNDVFL